VEYNTCGLSSSGTGSLFMVLFNAEAGSRVSGPTTQATTC
jgi:hypothetical protein